jgi:polar amino acid transport system permease protein
MNYTFDFMSVFANWDRLLMGAWLTIQLSALSIALGFVVGTLCAIAGKSRLALVRGLVHAYVEIIRNTPLLVQVFLVFFGLASIRWKLSAETRSSSSSAAAFSFTCICSSMSPVSRSERALMRS